jgi:glycosyltransferase involved in cell wall biosynthesis
MIKIAIVCEAFTRTMSGGRAAYALAEGLKSLGAHVEVWLTHNSTGRDGSADAEFGTISVNEDDATAHMFRKAAVSRMFPVSVRQGFRVLLATERMCILFTKKSSYGKLLERFRPDLVHFASFNFTKPAWMIDDALEAGAKVLLQPWVMRFACHQGFAYRDGKECLECFAGTFRNAIKRKCCGWMSGLIAGQVRANLRNSSRNASWFLSSNSDMDHKLALYGVAEEKILHLPLPFESNGLENMVARDDGYFIYHGQVTDYKGVHVIKRLLDSNTNVRIFICPPFGQETLLQNFGITEGDHPNLRIIRGVNWSNGLEQYLANSRGVLLPTLWPTTVEYALLESLALGKPTIAFAIGAHKDYLLDRSNAMVADPQDIDGYCQRVAEINSNAELRSTVSSGAKETYNRYWSKENWRTSLAACYSMAGVSFPNSRV